MTRSNPKSASHRRTVAALVLLVACAACPLAAGAAADVDYYNNSSDYVSSDSPENATFANLLDAAISIAPTFIGTGDVDPSQTGFEGVLLVGLAYASVAFVAIGAAGVGPVGGTVLGSVVAYGLVDLGFAPEWVKVLLLFGIGMLAIIAFRRVIR
jgi:hypothetical protein